jgi:putative membrane protein
MEPAIASALHVLGISLGFATLIWRDRAMKAAQRGGPLEEVFTADNISGLAAMLILGTGLWRFYGALQKPTDWYMKEYAFHAKMTLFGLGFALELTPMITFIQWRGRLKKGLEIDRSKLGRLRKFNAAEGVVYVAIMFTAAIMARGLWHKQASSAACRVEDAFIARCSTCHGGVAPQGQLVLAQGAHAVLVGVPSIQWPDQIRVVPGDAKSSLLWRKLTGRQAPHGLPMPMGLPMDEPLAEQVKAWIDAGAPACRR